MLVFFEIVRGCTFDVPQAYLTLCGTIEISWNSRGNVAWFPYSAGDSIPSDIPAEEVPGRKRFFR